MRAIFILAFSVAVFGQGRIDLKVVPSPTNPATGYIRIFGDSATGLFRCLTSTGASCIASGAYEPALGNPGVSGYVLSSTTGGLRSWIIPQSGPQGPAGTDGTNGTNGTNGVSVTSTVESPGVNCATGGVKFVSVSGTTYACNGAAGSNGQSVTVTAESAGANCTYAGEKLVSASGTAYVCNGAPGSNGTNGSNGAQGIQGIQGIQGPAGPAPTGTANQVLATPNGSSGVSALRALVSADIPANATLTDPDLGGSALSNTVTAGTTGVTAGHIVQKSTENPIRYNNQTSATATVKGIARTTATVGATFELAQTGIIGCVVEGAVTAGHYWTVGSIDKSKCLDTGQSALASICNAVPVGGVFQASGTDGRTVSASIDWNLHGGEICATDLPAIPNSSTTATSANTASTIVARDASGNFTAGTITAALTGTASAATTAAQVAGAAPPTSALAVGTNGSNQIVAWMDSTWAGTPSISSCGSGSSQLTSGSTDRRGTITEGATATGCTLTFSVGTHSTAICWLSSSTGLLFTYATTAGSGGGIVVSNAGMFALSGGNLTVGPTVTGNPILNYVCEP